MNDGLNIASHDGDPKLSIVIVLYKCSIRSSSTCTSLVMQQREIPGHITVLVYDNSPEPAIDGIHEGWLYVSDVTNGGLSKAYNYCFSLARQQGCDWMLLLDQDSVLQPDFLDGLLANISSVQGNPDIAAVVPRIFCGDRLISPVKPRPGKEVPFNRSGIVSSGWISAINSATAIRLSFLELLGGFSDEFWLDYLDYWFFRMLYLSGKRVWVSDACVRHELSVADLGRRLNDERFRNILAAEMRFTNRYLGAVWRWALAVRLFLRATRHLILGTDRKMAEIAFKCSLYQMRYASRLSRAK